MNATLARERGTAQLGLDEELAVIYRGSRVERGARDGRVDIVLSSDSVCNQEPHDLKLIETSSVIEAVQNLIDSVCIMFSIPSALPAIRTYGIAQEQDHQERVG